MNSRLLSYESDIWSLGVTFWELFSNGRTPYSHLRIKEVISRLTVGNLKPNVDVSWAIADILESIFSEGKYTDASQLFHDMEALSSKFSCLVNVVSEMTVMTE